MDADHAKRGHAVTKRDGYDGLPNKFALTKAEWNVIEHAAHNESFGWKFVTGRTTRKPTVIKLVERGLVADAGLVVCVDGDGCTIEPERWTQSYELTDAGRALHKRMVAARGGPVLLLAMQSALGLAIDGGLVFSAGDFEKIYSTMRGGYWFGESGENFYGGAVEAGNLSACRSFEAWKKRPALIVDGKRIAIGSGFIWQGQYVRTTSFTADGIVACSYKDKPGGEPSIRWTAIDKRYTITFDDFIAAERARLTSLEILKTSEAIAKLLHGTEHAVDVAVVAFWNDEQRDDAGAWASIAHLDAGKDRVRPPPAPAYVIAGAKASNAEREIAQAALAFWQRGGFQGVPSDYTDAAKAHIAGANKRKTTTKPKK